MDFGVSRRTITIALALLVVIYLTKLTWRNEAIVKSAKSLLDTGAGGNAAPVASPLGAKPYGQIKDKVAVISDTQFTARHVPLILHFHSVLGPEWPIIFYTTQATQDQYLTNNSAIWQRAIQDGRVEVRIIPDQFDLTQRQGVNLYLSRPWFWEQLAPAKRVLIFQADAMICGNSHRTVDDFMEWDFIGADLHGTEKLFNGGLSLRNRDMILDILREGHNWEQETQSGAWTMGGEDIWFSRKMFERGAHLPESEVALKFACEHQWHVERQKQPLGYHKVHKYAPNFLTEIYEWCPEIALAAPGTLPDGE